ncbi:MAG: CZB domain-containing protein [Bryobacteraceae bacterium]
MDHTAIDKGIAAHARWKARLNNAIDTGRMDVPVATVRVDNQCEFGKWLYGGEIPAEQKRAEHYATVRELHGRFHQAAARVVELAEAGKAGDARAEMASSGEFAVVSSKLTLAMSAWKKSLT